MEKRVVEKAIEQAKAGFTLVELLVVVAIIGILGAVAVANVRDYVDNARVTATRENINTIKQTLDTYSLAHNGKLPDSLSALIEGDDDNPPMIEGGEDALNDAWGNPIQYEKRGKRVILTSAGLDGEMGTEDDISNVAKKK